MSGTTRSTPLTPTQAHQYWLTVRRDWYWWDLGLSFKEAVRLARDDWALLADEQEAGIP